MFMYFLCLYKDVYIDKCVSVFIMYLSLSRFAQT